MQKIKKVFEPDNYNNYCERCDDYFCRDCIDFHKVEFDIIEKISIGDEIIEKNWNNQYVCPYCYNQLAEKFNKEYEEILEQ